MKIYLIRHGQSQWQTGDSRDLDAPLTNLGIRQSNLLAHYLSENSLKFTSLKSSPLKRACETASILAAKNELDVQFIEALAEAKFSTSNELPTRCHPRDQSPVFFPSPQYRSFKSQAAKALDALILSAEHSNGHVCAVSHGGLIRTLLRVIADTDNLCFCISNASVTKLSWRRGRWHIDYLNNAEHLPYSMRS
ncbi:histidine phosphatase family protein [Roseovarius tibetensis]|uniref:histidine phosphatase family protein n=1 Tax=Roseovarius tibetensis TaxID=2685897 RepID=UPI003D7F68A0